MCLLFGPLVLQVATVRLLETTMLRRGTLVPVETLLWTSGPLPFLNALIGLGVYRVARLRMPGVPAVIPSAIGTAAAALTSAASYQFAPWWITGWVAPSAIEVLRPDVLLVLAIATAAMLLLGLGGPRTRRCTRLTVHILVPSVMTVSLAGFVYVLSTGSPADWQIMKYSVANFGTIRELVAGSLKMYHLAILATPWLWSYALWLLHREPGRTAASAALRPSAVLSLAPLMVLLGFSPAANVPPSVNSGSLYRLVATAAVDIAGLENAVVEDIGAIGLPDFDATGLALDKTDSTITPNIVMVLMESVRSRSTTPYNPTLHTMPFLDSLGRAGAIVENMYAVVSYTNKSLVPIYAGIYPRPGRDVVEATPDAIPAKGLPDLLRPLGYKSAFFTSATMEFERKDRILDNLGFDVVKGIDDMDVDGFHKKAYFGYEDRAALGPALDWARTTSEDGHPFFLNFLTLTSHHPYDVPPKFLRMEFDNADRELSDYYNSLRYTDDVLRSIVRGLNDAGLAENTVFMFLGDHGEAFQEHMERTHGNVVWDEALQVPAVMFGPSHIKPGLRIRGARQHLDLLPTIADLLQTRLEGGYIPGRSLFATVADGRSLYHHSLDDGKVMALRRDSLKFMYFFKQRPTQVFNYLADPEERLDLAARYQAGVLARVELELLLWRKRVIAAYPERRRLRLFPNSISDSSTVATPQTAAVSR